MNRFIRRGYRSWPCTRPRGPRSSFRPSRSNRSTFPNLRSGPPPLRFSAPSTLPARGIHFPVRSSRRACTRASPADLVAGFHARFGPPSPFSTAWTVCSSSNPVTCFSHSRPWGWGSCSPLHVRLATALRPRLANVGGGLRVREVPGRSRDPARFSRSVRAYHRSGRRSVRSGSGSPGSMPTHHRSPARRSGRSSRDRAASGCPATAPMRRTAGA